MSLLEAMAAGVPVVASPVGGIPEVVVDGATGFLVGAGDTKSLARALRALLARPRARRAASATPRARRSRCASRAERALAPLEDLYDALGVSRDCGPRASRPATVQLKKAA